MVLRNLFRSKYVALEGPTAWWIWRSAAAPRWSSTVAHPNIASILEGSTASTTYKDQPIRVDGFVRTVRKQKRVAFAAIGDGSSLEPLQAVLKPEQAEGLSTGVGVTMIGDWRPSPPGKQQASELHTKEVKILGQNDVT
ncbi:asparaginyl-tRNA synthetase, partial [Cryomyces antarcticus]